MIDLKKLFQDLNTINKNKEPRLEILIIQLHMEHFLNELIKIKSGELPEEIIKENLTIPIKTKILQDWKIINEDHKKVIDALAKTRNDLIHNLIIDFEKIEKRLKSVNFDFIRDEKGKRVKIFSRLKPYHRLIFSSIAIIGTLYHKLTKETNSKPMQTIKMEIKKEGKEWQPKLTLLTLK